MPKKSSSATNTKGQCFDAPETLDEHLFYGLQLDDEQRKFRDAIWNKEKLIVFCNAMAGTGKTTIAVATANLLVRYGLYNGIVYIVSPYGENKQGFLPGDICSKSEIYFEPFYQALIKIGEDPNQVINTSSMVNQKMGTGYIECITHTYLRGTNLENKVVILDESQNYSISDLKKTLTRIADNCKTVVIGHTKQQDTVCKSGFQKYINHFDIEDPRVAICSLSTNYRGWISSYADQLEE